MLVRLLPMGDDVSWMPTIKVDGLGRVEVKFVPEGRC
jgi:hypothetical protein